MKRRVIDLKKERSNRLREPRLSFFVLFMFPAENSTRFAHLAQRTISARFSVFLFLIKRLTLTLLLIMYVMSTEDLEYLIRGTASKFI